jgi:hypothetical protein
MVEMLRLVRLDAALVELVHSRLMQETHSAVLALLDLRLLVVSLIPLTLVLVSVEVMLR